MQLQECFPKELAIEARRLSSLQSVILGLKSGDIEEEARFPDTNINYEDSGWKTALHWAAEIGNLEVTRLLLRLGANPNTGAKGYRPAMLYHAILDDDSAATPYQIDYTVPPPGSTIDSSTVLCPRSCQVTGRDAEIIGSMLEYGADINIKDSVGITALFQAVKENFESKATLLLCYGADMNIRSDSGDNCLRNAIIHGRHYILDALLQHAPNCLILDADGAGILHWVARWADIETLDILTRWSARFREVNLLNHDYMGRSCFDMVRERENDTPEWTVAFNNFIQALMDVAGEVEIAIDTEDIVGEVKIAIDAEK
jgi:ankyrin repeat protein